MLGYDSVRFLRFGNFCRWVELQWIWLARVRRPVQREFRVLWNIKAKHGYEKCVTISTRSLYSRDDVTGSYCISDSCGLKTLCFGPEVLGGLLAGVTVSGVLMGMFSLMPVVLGIMHKNPLKGLILMVKFSIKIRTALEAAD